MRKVIYTEWGGQAVGNVEKPGLFHGIFNAWDYADGTTPMPSPFAIIEKEDGSMMEMHPSLIRFVDKPEDEQLAEFAKAAMQGVLAGRFDGVNKWDGETLSRYSLRFAKAVISELKKQKP